MKVNLEIKFVISLIFAILVAIFAIQNAGSVEINFLFAKFTISQALIILISAVVGAIVILLISLINQIQQGKKIKILQGEIEKLRLEKEDLEESLDSLRKTDKIQEIEGFIDSPMEYPEKKEGRDTDEITDREEF